VSEQKQDEVNSSDPDIFEFTDENNSSNAVDAVSENRNAISHPSLLRNLFSSPVSESKKIDPGSSDPVHRRGLLRNLFGTAAVGKEEDDCGGSDTVRVATLEAVHDGKKDDDPGSSDPVRVATAVLGKTFDDAGEYAAISDALAVHDGKKDDDPGSSDPVRVATAVLGKTFDDAGEYTAISVALAVHDGKKDEDPGSSDPVHVATDAVDATTTIIDVTEDLMYPINEQTQFLSFPFLGGALVERAAEGLHLCDPMHEYKDADLITMKLEKSVGRN
jgi:hypothetical protein